MMQLKPGQFYDCVRAACNANTRGGHKCTYPDCRCTMEPIIVRAIIEELAK